MRSLWILLWICLAVSTNAFFLRKLGQLVSQAKCNRLGESQSTKSSDQNSQDLGGNTRYNAYTPEQASSGGQTAGAGLIEGAASLQRSYSRKATSQSESKEKSSESGSFTGSQISTSVSDGGASGSNLEYRNLAESRSYNRESEKSEKKKSEEEYQENVSSSMQGLNLRAEGQTGASQANTQTNSSENTNQVQKSESPENSKESNHEEEQSKEKKAKGTNSNKKKSRKAKVKSTQSIRILTPGRNTAGIEAAKAGTYSRKTTSLGQSASKHKSDSRSDSVATQVGSRTDSASVASSHERGVDANQNARITSDSTGMNEIVLTQTSLAQSKKRKSQSRSSSDAASSEAGRNAYGGTASIATSSKRASSSRSAASQQSEVVEESYNVKQLAGQQNSQS